MSLRKLPEQQCLSMEASTYFPSPACPSFPMTPGAGVQKATASRSTGQPRPHQRVTLASGWLQYPRGEMNQPLRCSVGSLGFVLPESKYTKTLRAYIKGFDQRKAPNLNQRCHPHFKYRKKKYDLRMKNHPEPTLAYDICSKELV